jgi:hypothetical protein
MEWAGLGRGLWRLGSLSFFGVDAGQYAHLLCTAGLFFGIMELWWVVVGGEEKVVVFLLLSSYFFSTLTFWLSQERPSKMPGLKLLVPLPIFDFVSIANSYLLRWWRNWARPSIRGPWLFCRGLGLGLRRLVALLSRKIW